MIALKKLSMSVAAVALIAACAASHETEKSVAAAPGAVAPVAPPAPPPPPPAPPSTPDAEFRNAKPAAAAAAVQFIAPVPTEKTLANGAKLLVVENHAVPLASIDLLIETGADGEPLGKTGLAKFTAAMLEEGTAKRSATELASQLEDLAAQHFAIAGQETIRVHMNCLTETLPQCLALLADMAVHPAFRKEDLERTRGLLLADVAQKQANPAALARDEMARVVYGAKSPWGQPAGGTEATLKAITEADLRRFHADYFRPTNAIISISGDVAAGQAAQLVTEAFASWKKEPRKTVKMPKVAASEKRETILVDKAGASQSQVWVFGTAVSAKDADAVPLRVTSYILGGPFARLDMNIREGKGYSYGVRSSVSLMREHGIWAAQGGVKANVTAEALVEYERELKGLATGALREGELKNAQEGLIRSLPSQLERNDAVSAAMATLAFNGQPLDYYRTLPAEVAKVDGAAVARVAAKYDRPGAWSVVIVGPKAVVEARLNQSKYGEVELPVAAPPAAK